ncbi:MAG: TRAP transporter substrate-binding protein DctP [Anaerolineales bacterium]|nr:TRAP transporter substrate-binding protein DctP [Anaerolineales bacterium]
MINRRDFLKAAGMGIAATALAACAEPAPAAEASTSANDLPDLDWQMATSWTQGLDVLFGTTQAFADRVAALTGGKFKITPRAGGELAKATEVLDVVSSGAVPIGHTASYYYIGKSWVMAFGTTLPFGLTSAQQNAWLYSGGGLELLQAFYAKTFNVIQFPAGNTSAQMGGWFRKEINTVADLQGLKMRIPGLGGQVMSELGVQVQNIPGGEIFQALETGAIDAAEWVGPYDDEKLGLNKTANYYYAPGWWEPGPTVELQINLDEWNKLPDLYKNAIQAAAAEANLSMAAKYEAANGEALDRLIAGGTELRTYSEEIMQAAKEKISELLDAKAAEDADFKAIYENWSAFREKVQKWSFTNEFSLLKFMEK